MLQPSILFKIFLKQELIILVLHLQCFLKNLERSLHWYPKRLRRCGGGSSYSCSVDNLKEKVKAIPFLIKATIMFPKLLLLMNICSGEEREKVTRQKLRKIKRHTSNRALGGQDNPQVPPALRL